MKPRLTSEDWIFAGFRALVASGPQALKAEALARALGTTKGSFYWHFKDVADFHAQMLGLWEARAYHAITETLDPIADPTERLHKLAVMAVNYNDQHGNAAAEPAIRAWARAAPLVARAVARIDTLRLGYIAGILQEIERPDPDLPRLIYGAYIGLGTLSATDGIANETAMTKLIQALLDTSAI